MSEHVVWHWRGKPVSTMTREEAIAALVEVMEVTHDARQELWVKQDEQIAIAFGRAFDAAVRARP